MVFLDVCFGVLIEGPRDHQWADPSSAPAAA